MLSLDRFSTLVADIYEAAVDPSLWEQSLGRIAAATRGAMGALLVYDPRKRSQFISVNLDPAQKRLYDDYYGRLDPVASVLGRTAGRKIITVREKLTETQLRGEFFNDWAHPNEVGDGIFLDVSQDCDRRCIFGLARRWRSEPFASAEVLRLVGLLAPHLQRAAQARSEMGPLEEIRDGALDLVEHWRRGCVVISREGDVLYANGAANEIVAACDGLGLDRRGLRAAAASEHAALLRLVGRACKADGDRPRSGGRIAISRHSGRRPYLIQVLPLGSNRAGILARPAAALAIIIDSEREVRLPRGDLRDLYGLTAAEADVAIRVLEGHGLQFAAQDLHIGLSTARAHLKHIFEKTGTHRQAELVRLLMELEAGGL
jgi:DNA-binding CsgD family transcriptional regulator